MDIEKIIHMVDSSACGCEGDENHGRPGHCWKPATCHVPRPSRRYKEHVVGCAPRTVAIEGVNLCDDCGTHYRKRGYTVKAGLAPADEVEGYELRL